MYGLRSKNIDGVIILLVSILLLFGLWAVFSSSSYISMLEHGSATYLFERHILRVGLGFIFMIIFSTLDYRILKDISKPMLIVTFILLIIVLFAGEGSARRWLYLGPISFQPSELAKLVLIISLAKMLEERQSYINSFKSGFLPPFLLTIVISGLILIEPSFSMFIIVFSVGIVLIFIGRAKLLHILSTIPVIVLSALLMLVTRPYISERFKVIFDPERASDEVKFQVNQALIALGQGGLLGVGAGNSKQREFFLPRAYEDYIFSIFGEEFGFAGSFILIFIFFLLFYRGIRIARYADDDFGRFLSAGISFMIFVTAMFHIGVVCKILPPTGIPLPFVSYGGSAIVINCISAGILLSISRQAKFDK
jgi:cell division protein FtsW